MGPKPVIKKIRSSRVADLIDSLKRVHTTSKLTAPYFVFKINEKLRNDLAGDANSRLQIVERSTNKPVFLLEYDYLHQRYLIHQITPDNVALVANPKLLNDIREFDLLEVIDNTKGDCILDAPHGTHFITPSEKHTTRFLRLADALHSYNAMDRISFWLQAEMAVASGVIADTWSLASVILNSQMLLEASIPFDCFRQHIRYDEDGAIEVLSKLSEKLHGNGKLLCLVSITSSGFFSRKFEELVHNANILNSPKVISIFKFKNSPEHVHAMATLDFDFECYDEQNCIYCKGSERQATYHIDQKFYDARLFQEETVRFTYRLLQEELTIERKHGSLSDYLKAKFLKAVKIKVRSQASKFIHTYGKNPGVLRVHRIDPNDGMVARHHAFYIDVATLLEDERFKEELISAFVNLKGEADGFVVVSPPHPAGDLLAAIACDKLNAKHIRNHTLRELSAEQRNVIASARHIVFLDDVLITGSRIIQYVDALRALDLPGLSKLKVTWFPVIARPPNEKVIDSIKDGLSVHEWANELKYLYKIELPNWGRRDCPWCHELKVFKKEFDEPFDEPIWYSNRRDLLAETNEDQGISVEPFFHFPNIERCVAGASSPIMDKGCSEMQVLFLIATGLQKLRNSIDKPLGRGVLHRYVLSMYDQDDKYCTLQRYSEPLFRSAFLRLVRNEEWDRDAKSKGIEYLTDKARQKASEIMLGEFVLFLHRSGYSGHLPKDFNDVLLRWDDVAIDALVNRFKVAAEE